MQFREFIEATSLYYHGTSEINALRIEQTGKLLAGGEDRERSRISTGGPGGTRDERGLIWVAETKEKARHVDGIRADRIFEVHIPFPLKIIERHEPITLQQAEILNTVNKRPYDPIEKGIDLNVAMFRLLQHPDAPQTYAEILPMLNKNAIRDKTGIGIAVPELPVGKNWKV
jgi:hypothetical protein